MNESIISLETSQIQQQQQQQGGRGGGHSQETTTFELYRGSSGLLARTQKQAEQKKGNYLILERGHTRNTNCSFHFRPQFEIKRKRGPP